MSHYPEPIPPQPQKPIPVWLGTLIHDGWLAGKPAISIAGDAGIGLREFTDIRRALGLPDRDHQSRIIGPNGDTP
jgi:hypothetical protein